MFFSSNWFCLFNLCIFPLVHTIYMFMNFQVILPLLLSICLIFAATTVAIDTCSQMKSLNQVLPKPRARKLNSLPHPLQAFHEMNDKLLICAHICYLCIDWVGDGFNVFPVFANLAFTNDISPFLMVSYVVIHYCCSQCYAVLLLPASTLITNTPHFWSHI